MRGTPCRPVAGRRRPQSPVRRDCLDPRRAGLALTRRRCLRIDCVDVVGQLRDRLSPAPAISATGPGPTDKRCVLRRPRYAPGPRPHPPRRRYRFEASRVVVIGHGVWQRLYGGDPSGRRPDDGARSSRVAHHRRRHAARADPSRRRRSVGAGRGRGRTEGAAASATCSGWSLASLLRPGVSIEQARAARSTSRFNR